MVFAYIYSHMNWLSLVHLHGQQNCACICTFPEITHIFMRAAVLCNGINWTINKKNY